MTHVTKSKILIYIYLLILYFNLWLSPRTFFVFINIENYLFIYLFKCISIYE